MYDVAIIGAGVVGCAIARELSRYDARICVIERAEDVCCGTSKANSAIIHAGYDAEPGTLKAELNVKGNAMMTELARDLEIPFKRNGSLVVMYKGDDRSKLEELLERGRKNGVPDLRIIETEELRKLEPNLSTEAVAALYAPTAGIVCPFNMTIAFAENAVANGAEFMLDTEVTGITRIDGGYRLNAKHHPAFAEVTDEVIEARAIVNAAGVYSDVFHNMVSEDKIRIIARRGCYFLLDRAVGDYVHTTVFTLPGPMGKGILTAPTVHGNILVGPDAMDTDDKESTCTLAEELNNVRASAERNMINPPLRKVITSFAGLRAHEEKGDFVLGECNDAEFFFDAAGVESPGLSASPAIGVYLADQISSRLALTKKASFTEKRKGILNPSHMTIEERTALIKEHPEYGNIICRCESVSEGEILDAIRRPLGARSLDGVKRRTRAGMGRCQAGFCSPRTMEILSRELGLPLNKITKSGGGSYLIPNVDINDKYRQGE